MKDTNISTNNYTIDGIAFKLKSFFDFSFLS